MRRTLRVAAYAVCVRDGQVLLARASEPPGGIRDWLLPGGGMEHGEHPEDTVVREVAEETGYAVEVTGLLGVDSLHRTFPGSRGRRPVDHHGIRLVYEARVTGGELRHEIGGSTDLAAWHALTAVPALPHIPLIDTALHLWRDSPYRNRPHAAD